MTKLRHIAWRQRAKMLAGAKKEPVMCTKVTPDPDNLGAIILWFPIRSLKRVKGRKELRHA